MIKIKTNHRDRVDYSPDWSNLCVHPNPARLGYPICNSSRVLSTCTERIGWPRTDKRLTWARMEYRAGCFGSEYGIGDRFGVGDDGRRGHHQLPPTTNRLVDSLLSFLERQIYVLTNSGFRFQKANWIWILHGKKKQWVTDFCLNIFIHVHVCGSSSS